MAQTEPSPAVHNTPAPYPHAASADTDTALEEPKKRNPLAFIILLLVLLGGGYYGYTRYQFAKAHESTDDAQVKATCTRCCPAWAAPCCACRWTKTKP